MSTSHEQETERTLEGFPRRASGPSREQKVERPKDAGILDRDGELSSTCGGPGQPTWTPERPDAVRT